MVEGVEISIFFDNTHKKYHILAGISSFVFMKKFTYRTEDSEGSEAQKQRPNELLWMLWFYEKSIFNAKYFLVTKVFDILISLYFNK